MSYQSTILHLKQALKYNIVIRRVLYRDVLGHGVQGRRRLRSGRRFRSSCMSLQPQLHRGTGIVHTR